MFKSHDNTSEKIGIIVLLELEKVIFFIERVNFSNSPEKSLKTTKRDALELGSDPLCLSMC